MLSPPPPPPVPGLSPSLQYSQWSLFFSPYFALFFFRLLMAPTIITIFLFSRHIYPYFWHFYPAFPKKNPPPPEEETKREGVFQHTHTHTGCEGWRGWRGFRHGCIFLYDNFSSCSHLSEQESTRYAIYIYIPSTTMCTYNMAALEPFSIEQGKGGGLSWRGSENSTHTHTPKSEIIINKNRLHQLKILRSTYLAYSWVLSVAIGHLLPSSSFPFPPPSHTDTPSLQNGFS